MNLVTQCYKLKMKNVKDSDIDKMMNHFQTKMKQRYKIPPSMVEKFKDDICCMLEIDKTYKEAMEPRVKFIEPMGYEMSIELIEGYAQVILQSKKDIECPRWGNYKEKMR